MHEQDLMPAEAFSILAPKWRLGVFDHVSEARLGALVLMMMGCFVTYKAVPKIFSKRPKSTLAEIPYKPSVPESTEPEPRSQFTTWGGVTAPFSHKQRSTTLDGLQSLIARSMVAVVSLSSSGAQMVSKNTGFLITDRWFLSVGHGVLGETCICVNGSSFMVDRVKQLGTDLVLLRTKLCVPSVKPLAEFITRNPPLSPFIGQVSVWKVAESGEALNYSPKHHETRLAGIGTLVSQFSYPVREDSVTGAHVSTMVTHDNLYVWSGDTRAGMCGSIVIQKGNGDFGNIVGVLVGGTYRWVDGTMENATMFEPVRLDQILSAIGQEPRSLVSDDMSGAVWNCPQAGTHLVPMAANACVSYHVPECPVRFVGSVLNSNGKTNHPFRKRKSECSKTVFYDYVAKIYPPVRGYEIPQFNRVTDHNGRTLSSPYDKNVDLLFQKKAEFTEKELDNAMRDYVSGFKNLNAHKGPVSIFEALHGFREIPRLNFSTSTGFPMHRKKRDVLKLVDPVNNYYELDMTTAAMVDWILDQYKKGNRVYPVFTSSLKDEIVSAAKNKSGKIRMFQGCMLAWMVIFRQYLLPFMTWFMENREDCEHLVGVHTFSEDWGKLYTSLKGLSVTGGDKSSFDKILSRALLEKCWAVIFHVYIHSGWSEEDLQIVRMIMEDCCSPTLMIKGDLVVVEGTNPSGVPVTTIINCIAQSLMFRVAFSSLYGENYPFRTAVFLRTFGDDDIQGVHKGFERYNHISIRDFFSTRGIIYTMPDKESEATAFMEIWSVDFLKRKFLPVSVDGNEVILDPLDEKSLYRMLAFRNGGSAVDERTRLVSVLEAFTLEIVRQPAKKAADFLTMLPHLETIYADAYGIKIDLSCYSLNDIVRDVFLDPKHHVHRPVRFSGPSRWLEESDEGEVPPDQQSRKTIAGSSTLETKLNNNMMLNNTRSATEEWHNSCGLTEKTRVLSYSSAPPAENKSELAGNSSPSPELKVQFGDVLETSRCLPGEGRSDIANTTVRKVDTTVAYQDSSDVHGVTIDDTRSGLELSNGHERSELSKFLSRPVRIFSTEWVHGNKLNVSFDPWNLWRTNVDVVEKLKRYALIRMDLKLRIVCNGVPVHMGRFMVSYTTTNVRSTWASVGIVTAAQEDCMFSQCPGTRECPLAPNKGEAFEMTLPFFYQYPYHSLNVAFTDMCDAVRLISFSNLATINGTVTNVPITVLAYAENVELLVPQPRSDVSAGEEAVASAQSVIEQAKAAVKSTLDMQEDKPDGTVSAITSAFARAAGELTGVPIIGPWMTPGEKALQTITNAAKFFGFARPPVYTDVQFLKNFPYASLANTSGADPIQKLSFDPKQALTVDPRTVGCPTNADEMSVAALTRTWSYLTSFTWDSSDVAGDILFEILVQPRTGIRVADADGDIFQPTSVAAASIPFKFWSGTMEYKFIVASTQYHNGRIAFTYDPDGNGHLPLETNVQYVDYLDLRSADQTTFSVSWSQPRTYQLMPTPNEYFSTVGTIYATNAHNGSVRASVLNGLKSSFTNTSVQVYVFVRGGTDLDFAVPSTDWVESYSQYNFGASEVTTVMEMQSHEDAPDLIPFVGRPDPGATVLKNYSHFGESVVSFRSLMKRYTRYRCVQPSFTSGSGSSFHTIDIPVFGFPIGLYETGILGTGRRDIATGNPVQNTLISWMNPYYGGMRGGLRFKTQVMNASVNSSNVLQAEVSRAGDQVTGGPFAVSTTTRGASTQQSPGFSNGFARTFDGVAVTAINNQPVLDWEVPFYLPERFVVPQFYEFTDNSLSQANSSEIAITSWTNQATTPLMWVDIFIAAGEDFQFFWYQGATPFRIL
jgi:hypothetical protein